MELGKEIKQKQFSSYTEKALINLLYTHNRMLSQLNHLYKAKGLQNQHFNVLRIIRGKYPDNINPGQIKEVMLDKGRDLTRLLDKLEKMDFIVRRINPQNRRLVDITMTNKGILITQDLSRQVNDWMRQKLTISESEAKQLSALLDKFRG